MTENPNLVAGDADGTPLDDVDHLVNGRVPGEGSGLWTENEDGAVEPTDDQPLHTEETETDELAVLKQPFDIRQETNRIGSQFDGFEDGWTVVDGSDQIEDGELRPGSDRLRIAADDGDVTVEKTVDGLDLRGKMFSLGMKVYPTDTTIALRLYSSDSDYVEFVAKRKSEDGAALLYSMGVASDPVVGDPNLGSVEKIEITTPDSDANRVGFEEIRAHAHERNPRVIFQFDDGYDSVYDVAFPHMQQYGFIGNIAIISGRLGEDGWLDSDQIDEMYAEGWEVSNHTVSHDALSEMSEGEQRKEIEQAKRTFVNEHGWKRGVDHFVAPFHRHTETTRDLISEYHVTNTNVMEASINPEVAGPMNLQRAGGNDPDVAKGLIDQAEQFGTTLILTFHDVDDGEDWIAANDFRDVVDYAASADVEVVGMDDVFTREALTGRNIDRSEREIMSSAYLGATSQTIGYDSLEVVEFDTIRDFNDLGALDTSDGTYTVPMDGRYQVNAALFTRDQSDGDFAEAFVYRGLANQGRIGARKLSDEREILNGTVTRSFEAGDELSIRVEFDGDGGIPRIAGGGIGHSFVEIKRIGDTL